MDFLYTMCDPSPTVTVGMLDNQVLSAVALTEDIRTDATTDTPASTSSAVSTSTCSKTGPTEIDLEKMKRRSNKPVKVLDLSILGIGSSESASTTRNRRSDVIIEQLPGDPSDRPGPSDSGSNSTSYGRNRRSDVKIEVLSSPVPIVDYESSGDSENYEEVC